MSWLSIDQDVHAIATYLRASDKAVIAAYIALFGTLFTLAAKAIGQLVVDFRNHRHDVLVARTSLYAEIRRTKITTQGHIDFVEYDSDGWNGMIWLVVFPTLYPTPESLKRINMLTAAEVRKITSFFFVYKETIGFLKASAMEIVPLFDGDSADGGKRRAPFFGLDMDMLEYVYSDERMNEPRRQDLLYRLGVIEQQSTKAIAAIAEAVAPWFGLWPSALARLIEADTEQDSAARATRSAKLQAEEAVRLANRKLPAPVQPALPARASRTWLGRLLGHA